MKFPYLTGEVGNVGISRVKKRSIGSASWWLAGGIDPSSVAAVWQPKGAASLAASYLRLAGSLGYANTDPVVVGGVAPTWDATNGWTGGSGAYLKTGVIPAAGWSAIVRFSGATLTTAVFGCVDATVTQFFHILPDYFFGIDTVSYGNGGAVNYAPKLLAGTLAIAGQSGYRNGAFDGAIISGTVPALEIYLLGRNFAGALNIPFLGSLQAIAFYIDTKSAPQIAAVDAAMIAL